MKWEYTVRPIKTRENDDRFDLLIKYLNIQGDSGWELVSVDNSIAYFKRPILEKIPKEAYTHETVQDGYVIFESDGRALPAWEVVKLLNNKTDYKQVYDD